MILCHCAVVTSGEITTAVADGACTVSEVCRRTGAAQNCGTCIFSVKQVVCQYVERGVDDPQDAIRAAS